MAHIERNGDLGITGDNYSVSASGQHTAHAAVGIMRVIAQKEAGYKSKMQA